MRGTATREKKPRRQKTGRGARCKRCRPAGPRRGRDRHPAQIEVEGPVLPGIEIDRPVLTETAPCPLNAFDDDDLVHIEDAAIEGIALPALDRRLQKRYLITELYLRET
jgi:hypothetical protein